jgi:hypothetical protein
MTNAQDEDREQHVTDDQRRQQSGQEVNETPTPDSMAPAEEFIAPGPHDPPPQAGEVRQPVPEGDEAADPDDTAADRR